LEGGGGPRHRVGPGLLLDQKGGLAVYSPKQFAEMIVKAVKDGDDRVCRFYYFQNGMIFQGSSNPKILPIVFCYRKENVVPLIKELEIQGIEFHAFPVMNGEGLVLHLLRSERNSCEECAQYKAKTPPAPRKSRGGR